MYSQIRQFGRSVLGSYAGILYSNKIWIGAWLSLLTLANPNAGFSGFVTVLSAYMFSRLLGKSEDFLHLPYHIYNPLLVGLSLGTIFKLGSVSLFFLITMGILTFLITSCMAYFFTYYFKLPILSLPFVICSFIAHLAAFRYSGLFVRHLYVPVTLPFQGSLPMIFSSFFKSLGSIFCLPEILVGIGIFLVLFAFSRILTFLAITGFLTGVLSDTILTSSFHQAVNNPNSFNYVLIATAVGGVFLVPSIRSYIMAILAVIISVPVIEACQIFWVKFGIPVFALPFNFMTMVTIYALGISNTNLLARQYLGSPEATLDNHITVSSRFPEKVRSISLPFAGTWTTWQSFDGEWTHKGPWKYGLDFIVTDEREQSFENSGENLTAYYSFRKPVLSPVIGEVTVIVDNVADNAPGSANKADNWGNYVIIYDSRGFYVLLSHFVRGSIKVQTGSKVQIGQFLGLCGNSGYSPQPHIHMQVQLEPKAGAPTVPFTISSWITPANEWSFGGVPGKNEKVTGINLNRNLAESLEYLIGQELEFEFFINDERQNDLKLQANMASDSTRYLTDGKGILYTGSLDNMFCVWRLENWQNSALKHFLAAAPRIPLSLEAGLQWSDLLPLELIECSWRREIYRFISSFDHRFCQVEARYMAITDKMIEGKIAMNDHKIETRLELDTFLGIKKIEIFSNKQKILIRRKT
jgi:urea transporter/murein DD-endopeptidase MepM/ murein hydrolase activator NlpD